MLLLLTLEVDRLRAWVPCTLLSASMVPFASGALAVGTTSWILSAKISQKLDNFLYKQYMRLCLFVFENLSGVQLIYYGDAPDIFQKAENVLILSNHQSNVDWAVIMMLTARQDNEKGFRVMVKQTIHYVPLFGWYIFQHGYIYVRRFGNFVGQPVVKQLEWMNKLADPYALLLFPEGTRYSLKKVAAINASNEYLEKMSRPPLKHLFCPKSGGIKLAMDHLNSLDAVYDVTIGYEHRRLHGESPGMFSFCCGPREGRSVHVHVKRFEKSQIPTEKEALRTWIIDRYQEKDLILEEFLQKGLLPGPGHSVNAVPLTKTLLPTVAFTSALLAPLYSETVRNVYKYTILSSPFLIAYLHLRKCV